MKVLSLVGLGLLLLFAGSNPANGQNQDDELSLLSQQPPAVFAAVRSLPGLVALTFVGVNKELLVVARRMVLPRTGHPRGLQPPWGEASKAEGPIDDVVEFYRREGTRFFKIAESHPGYIFVGMLSKHERGADLLVTTWETGSAKAMIIFARRSHQVVKAFSWAGIVAPEFVGLANDGESFLVVTDGRIFQADGTTTYPETASIYAWEGSRYLLKKRVPWEKRFEALKDRWPRDYPKK